SGRATDPAQEKGTTSLPRRARRHCTPPLRVTGAREPALQRPSLALGATANDGAGAGPCGHGITERVEAIFESSAALQFRGLPGVDALQPGIEMQRKVHDHFMVA